MRQICGYENLKKSHQRLFRWEVTDDLLIEAERLKRVLYIAELPGDEGEHRPPSIMTYHTQKLFA